MLDQDRIVKVLAFEAENRRSVVVKELESIIDRLQTAKARLEGENPYSADVDHNTVRQVADAATCLAQYKVMADQLARIQNGSYDQK